VFFSKNLDWSACDLHAYEADGTTTRYTVNGPRFNDSWCGTIPELKVALDFNGVGNVTIHNANQVKMTDLPGPFDLVYGFYNIGFHWSLEHFLPEIMTLIGDGVGIFTLSPKFEPFPALKSVNYEIVEGHNPIKDIRDRLIVLRAHHQAANLDGRIIRG